jgi:hypothetical protein
MMHAICAYALKMVSYLFSVFLVFPLLDSILAIPTKTETKFFVFILTKRVEVGVERGATHKLLCSNKTLAAVFFATDFLLDHTGWLLTIDYWLLFILFLPLFHLPQAAFVEHATL